MFNLETAIAEWRRQMTSAGLKSPALLDELESHLRDDIDQRLKSGLNLEQSFEAATVDVGQPAFIRREFKKTRPDKVTKVIGWAALAMYTLASLPLFFAPMIGASPSEKLAGLVAILMTFVVVLGSDHAWRFLPMIRARNIRATIGISCAVLGAMVPYITFSFIMPRLDPSPAQIVVSVLWALIPLIIGGAMFAWLNDATKRRLASMSS